MVNPHNPFTTVSKGSGSQLSTEPDPLIVSGSLSVSLVQVLRLGGSAVTGHSDLIDDRGVFQLWHPSSRLKSICILIPELAPSHSTELKVFPPISSIQYLVNKGGKKWWFCDTADFRYESTFPILNLRLKTVFEDALTCIHLSKKSPSAPRSFVQNQLC